jgi:hypothetical protein
MRFDKGLWKPAALALINVRVVEHDAVAVEAVNDDVGVRRVFIIAHDRHCIAVLLDAVIEEL